MLKFLKINKKLSKNYFRQFFITDLSNIEVLESELNFEPLYEKLNEETGEMEKRYNPESDNYKNTIAKV